MMNAVKMLDDSPMGGWVEKIYIEEGQAVVPGALIADVVVDGVARQIKAVSYGVVGWVSDKIDLLVKAGEIIAYIISRFDHGRMKEGLHPRNAGSLRRLNFAKNEISSMRAKLRGPKL